MNIQIFGSSKCFDTKKAERYFKERGIKFQSIDLPRKGMSRGELTGVISAVGGIDGLINGKKDRFSQRRNASTELFDKLSRYYSFVTRNTKLF